ncbi:hypothetical protein SRHO_G00023150 [Serrasalmus rhombeus]
MPQLCLTLQHPQPERDRDREREEERAQHITLTLQSLHHPSSSSQSPLHPLSSASNQVQHMDYHNTGSQSLYSPIHGCHDKIAITPEEPIIK